MPKKTSKNIDLAQLFGSVVNNLQSERENLNQADTYNHDHGDNMVEIFEVITQAMQEKKNADPADQLAYASQLLRRRKSGSAQVYANGLAQASQQFQGQNNINPNNAGMLLQALLGGGQAPAAPQPQANAGGDLLGALLGGLTGQPSQQQPASDGLDLGDLLNAGMAFMNAKQQGSSTAEAAINALLSASPLGQSSHRTQSGTVVANTIMQMLGSMSQ